jgi:glycosyltransferase involved in cell wall biosynthesis
MQKISAVIISFNEEKRIATCLASLQGVADEVLVMDAFSTDNTVGICRQFGAKVYQQAWAGFGKQKNDAVAKASYDMILSLDADEVITDELARSIIHLKKQACINNLYRVKRLNNYYGKFIRHGMENPDIKPRLYNRRFAKWNQSLVHEALEYEGNAAPLLSGWLHHFTYNSIAEHQQKADKYTSLAAEDYFKKGKPVPGFIKLVASPAFTFCKAYLLRAGFLDGWHGWIVAKMHANGVLLKYSKLKMMYYNQKNKA